MAKLTYICLVSFLYPLFLIAGLALAIPILIHLFNLRRYKTVYFPHTRFLKNIQLVSRKQSQVKYKWLLAMRLLFLISLILAFAQPFFNTHTQKDSSHKLQIIYIDNSYSMSVKKGARSLLETAKDAAHRQVQKSAPGSKYILLTNDKPATYQPLPAEKILNAINNIDISAANKNERQIIATVQSLVQNDERDGADLYYYSDFQKSGFAAVPDASLLQHINFHGVPVQTEEAQNIYIDTAYLNSPVLQTGQSNQLIVHTRSAGKQPKDMPVLQLSVNGQVKSAASLSFAEKNESIDTLSFQVNDANWQKLTLTLNDAAIKFDDTFRIAARSAPNLSILVINEGQSNPYIQAAFRAYNGFRLSQSDVNDIPKDWSDYNLVILNNLTRIDETLGKQINNALKQGQSICLLPGKTNNTNQLNEGLHQAADIKMAGPDTTVQTTSSLQQGNDLVKGLFEKLPENVMLPTANWHYIINSGLSANGQAIISFRNGDPFLANYKPARGQLYICATSADLQSGNFPGSYFFAPFLYQMAMQSHSSDIYALTSGKQQAAYLPLKNASERNMVHLYGNGIDVIPPQNPEGAGLNVFADQSVQQPGFYILSAKSGDTSVIAMNADRNESEPEVWGINALKDQWKGANISWLTITESGRISGNDENGFPLWKVCVILALVMLTAETFLLAGNLRKQTVATQ